MNARQRSDKFQALARYIENYDYANTRVLMFPKKDGQLLQEACEAQVEVPVKLNKEKGILYCPKCERHARKNYDVYCSGCGVKLSYDEEEE